MKKEQKRVLIVDDMQAWIDFHIKALQNIYGDLMVFETALSAKEGQQKLFENIDSPYDLIITDLQMESDFSPKHAGQWFVEKAQELKQFDKTPIIIISAAYNIRKIAQDLKVNCLPKSSAYNDISTYKYVLDEILH